MLVCVSVGVVGRGRSSSWGTYHSLAGNADFLRRAAPPRWGWTAHGVALFRGEPARRSLISRIGRRGIAPRTRRNGRHAGANRGLDEAAGVARAQPHRARLLPGLMIGAEVNDQPAVLFLLA